MTFHRPSGLALGGGLSNGGGLSKGAGLSLPSSGGGGYVAPAVHFDNSTFLSIASLTSTDNAVWSWSGWFKQPSGDLVNIGPALWVVDPQGTFLTSCTYVQDGSVITNLITALAGNPSLLTTTQSPNVDQWFNLVVSGDISGATMKGKVYLNDVDVTDALPVTGANTIASNGLPFWISWDSFAGDKFIGDMADLWIAPGVSLLDGGGDIPVATRRLFINASGKPVDPSGFPASAMLFSGNAASFGTNQGSGGAFTTTGTLTNASSSPSN